MVVKVPVSLSNYSLGLDTELKKLNSARLLIAADLYGVFLTLTREINELSQLILELDDFHIDISVNEFVGQF